MVELIFQNASKASKRLGCLCWTSEKQSTQNHRVLWSGGAFWVPSRTVFKSSTWTLSDGSPLLEMLLTIFGEHFCPERVLWMKGAQNRTMKPWKKEYLKALVWKNWKTRWHYEKSWGGTKLWDETSSRCWHIWVEPEGTSADGRGTVNVQISWQSKTFYLVGVKRPRPSWSLVSSEQTDCTN